MFSIRSFAAFVLLAALYCPMTLAVRNGSKRKVQAIDGHHHPKRRGLKKGAKINKDPPFKACEDLVPAGAPQVDFNIDETCLEDFWLDQSPWEAGAAAFLSYLPACSCVVLASGCLIQVEATFVPLYGVAQGAGYSEEDAIEFASGFVSNECVTFVQARARVQYLSSDDSEDLNDFGSNDR